MKKSILFCIMLLAAMATFATPVGKARATRVAQNAVALFCAELHNTDAKQPVELTPVSLGMEPKLYIFNFRNNGIEGFIIVSGDDMADPVLAFSDEGMLDLSGTYNGSTPTVKNPAFLDHLLRYMDQIDYGQQTKATAPAHVALKWQKLESGNTAPKGDFYHDRINKLLSTRWDQSKPYNNYCPGNSVTGCVATAFAQIMRVWSYPEHGFGYHAYNGENNPAAYPNWRWGVLEADYENTYYDWEHMPDYLTLNSPAEEIDAVAKLMFHVGVAFEMKYTPNGSGSWSLPEYAIFDTSLHLGTENSAPYCLHKYFGYKCSYSGMRDSIGDDTLWMTMIYNSLSAGMPVYYAGWAKDDSPAGHSGTEGHAYVIDGYFSDEVDSNLFHINWGWGGTANAYFKLDAMTPNGTDFTQWHGAVIGMEPDTSYHGYNYLDIHTTETPTHQLSVRNHSIVAQGVAGQTVALYDVMGRRLAYRAAEQGDSWTVPAKPGIYIVRIGQQPGQKVIVLK